MATHPRLCIWQGDVTEEDKWWGIAYSSPQKALADPLAGLMLLAYPERWVELETDRAGAWISNHLDELSLLNQQLLAADCAEHVLSLFTSTHPTDKRPEQAIAMRRRYTRHEATPEEWRTASENAYTASIRGDTMPEIKAAQAASEHYARESMRHAIKAKASAAWKIDPSRERQAHLQEQVWQWRRLLWYLDSQETQDDHK